MPPQQGNLFLLKEGDGQPTEVFTTVAGLRTTSFSINGEMVNVTDKDSAGLRELLAGGGEKALTIQADGVYEGTAQQTSLRDRAKDGSINNYQIDDGVEILEGAFQITSYEHGGDKDAEQTFSVTLESSGDWTVA